MNTEDIISAFSKIPVVSGGNLSLLLEKRGSSLTYWLKKLVADGVLLKLKNGLFLSKIYEATIISNPGEKEKLMEYAANRIRVPSYISLEYVLYKYSFIPEGVFSITSVTVKSTRSYMTKVGNFIYRNIKPEFYNGFLGVPFNGGEIKIASFAKAIFDYLYLKKFGSKKYIKPYLLSEGRLNWGVLTDGDRKDLAGFLDVSGSAKMEYVKKILLKERLI